MSHSSRSQSMLAPNLGEALAFARSTHHLIATVQEISALAHRTPATRTLAMRLDTALAEAFPETQRHVQGAAKVDGRAA